MKDKLTRAEFLKLLLPIQGWVARCDNLLFDSFAFDVINHAHDSEGLTLRFTYFPINCPDFMLHGNGHINLYQFHGKAELLERKEKIKRFLKVRTQEELDKFMKEFVAIY